jgi:hypothetical protein
MSLCKVRFFKKFLDSKGHPLQRLQCVVEVRHARSIDRAVQAAERKYEHLHHLPYWWLHADFFEVEIDGRKIDYHPSPLQG